MMPPKPDELIKNPEYFFKKSAEELRPAKDLAEFIESTTSIITNLLSLPYDISNVMYEVLKRRKI